MKKSEDGKITMRILFWGCTGKRGVHGSLNNTFQDPASEFVHIPTEPKELKVDDIFWSSHLVQSTSFENLLIEIYFINHKNPPPHAKRFSIEWLNDYTEEEKKVLKVIFPSTDAVLFIANANKLVDDKKNFSIKPVDEWKRTRNSLQMLKEVAKGDLAKKIPLISMILYPDLGSGVKSFKSPNTITKEEYRNFLEEEGLDVEDLKIIESLVPTNNLPTKSLKVFFECVRLAGFYQFCERHKILPAGSNSTLTEIYSKLIEILK